MKNKYPEHNDLICRSFIFGSHDDFTIVIDVWAGYDSDFNLIVMCEHTDYDEPDYNCATYAVINKDEAYRLARKLKVSMTDLPLEITEAMSEWNEIICPLPKHARDCFKEITECLIDEGCHFRMRRKMSNNGYFTC